MSKFVYEPADPIFQCDTTGMTGEEFTKARLHGGKEEGEEGYIPITIGASSVSIPLGVNPWVSDMEWRDSKMGITPKLKVEFNEEAKEVGHIFEPFVAYSFIRKMKKEFPDVKINLIKDMFRDTEPYLESMCPDKKTYEDMCKATRNSTLKCQKKWPYNPSAMYRCGARNDDGTLRYPFLCVNFDGFVEVDGKLGVWEAKTTNYRSRAVRDYWEQGIVPPYYYWQLVAEMAVMNVDFAYITCCWGFQTGDNATILVERDLETEESLLEFLRKYVEDMEAGLPLEKTKSDPELVNQYYFRLFGEAKAKADPVVLPNFCGKYITEALAIENEITGIKETLEELEKRRALVCNEIYPFMEENAYAKATVGGNTYGVRIKTSMRRAKFDEETFKKENPELAKEFTVTSINTTALGKAHRAIKKRYTLDPEPNPEGKPSFEIYAYDA